MRDHANTCHSIITRDPILVPRVKFCVIFPGNSVDVFRSGMWNRFALRRSYTLYELCCLPYTCPTYLYERINFVSSRVVEPTWCLSREACVVTLCIGFLLQYDIYICAITCNFLLPRKTSRHVRKIHIQRSSSSWKFSAPKLWISLSVLTYSTDKYFNCEKNPAPESIYLLQTRPISLIGLFRAISNSLTSSCNFPLYFVFEARGTSHESNLSEVSNSAKLTFLDSRKSFFCRNLSSNFSFPCV